ncbi:MAG TPA: trigger factor [Caulobacteraceae bacterium]
MQVTEKSGGGLSRVYGVRIEATELGALLDARIAEITPTLNLKGFRPGKVPSAHVRRIYGKALMGEVVEKTLNESSQKVLAEQQLRIAAQPNLEPKSDMDQVIAGREDLTYDLNVEVMPEFEPMDVATLKLTRPVYRPSPAELDEELAELATQSRTFAPRAGKAAKAAGGDQVVIDFVGTIDGEVFEGGTAEDAEVVLGSGQFIPGFEDQLIGAGGGDRRTVETRFPDDYQVDRLKGKAAQFEVTVKEVRAPKAAKADNALAERLGMKDLAALKDAVRANQESRFTSASRFKLKRALLDELDREHDIPLPPRMVDAEFAGIWTEVEKDKAANNTSPEDEGKSEETLRAEYRQIAERRVRLGLVLAEIGRRNNVQVTDQELSEAMRAEASRYGGQAQQMFDFMRQNANVQAQLRAPVYEEKVVDLVLSRASVTEKLVTKAELLKEDDLPEGYGAGPRKAAKVAKAGKPKGAKAKPIAKDAPEQDPAPARKPARAAAAPSKPANAKAAPAPSKPGKAKAAAAKKPAAKTVKARVKPA